MRLTGLGVSPGVGLGKALVVPRDTRDLGYRIPAAAVTREQQRLDAARERSRAQITRIRERLATRAGAEHAYLFDAQLLMLDDPMLIDRAREVIGADRLNAVAALRVAFAELAQLFDDGQDAYLRERKGDVADVVGRLSANLRQEEPAPDLFREAEGPFVLIAAEVTPSVLAQLDWPRLAGLVTDAGSWTSHTAILARSLHVPAVAGVHRASAIIHPGAVVAIDGASGEVIIEPAEERVRAVLAIQAQRRAKDAELEAFQSLPSITTDGVTLRLEANVEQPADATRAIERGADGIGLFRSEFLMAGAAGQNPDEEAQFEAYRDLVLQAGGRRVTVRTFDISEGQLFADPRGSSSLRAPLGRRGVRLSLAIDPFFQAQLRALVRAAALGPLRVMFPFVSGVDELRAAREALGRAREAVRQRGEPLAELPVGVMIELPSAALTADLLAREADFFSIGTNDLIQYCLAVDRSDDRVSGLYDPLHPAIVRAIRLVARAGRRQGIPVAVCGEMAADPAALALLVGLGLREFSMATAALPAARQVLRTLDAGEARTAAGLALRAPTPDAVRQILADLLAAAAPAPQQ